MRSFILLVLALFVATPAGATTYVPVDFSELVRGARVVVYGRVVDVRTVRTDDRIETRVTLEAREYFKGDFGPAVTFVVPGGVLGRYRTILVGAPRFTPGDEVVLFLNSEGPALPWVSGLSQGVFRIQHRGANDEPVVTPPPVGVGVTTGPAAQRIVRGDPARQPLALSDFAAAVRTIAEHQP